MDIDHGRLGRLREGQGEIANHVIDEYAAGRLSRRDFLRRGAVVGISLPVLGAVISACGSSGSSTPSTSSSSGAGAAGATIKAGIVVPTATINPVTVADQGGLDMLGQTGEYLTFSNQHLTLQPALATSWTPNSTADVWTFKIRQGVKFHNGQPLTADDVVYTYKLQTDPKSSANALSAFGGGLTPDGVSQGGRLHRRLPPHRAERELPVPDVVRQLQHDHHPEQLRPGEVAEFLHRDRAVRAEELHAQGRRLVHPQRAVLGHQGPARRDRVHLLRHPDAPDPRPHRRDHRRRRAVRRRGRRAAARPRGPVQHHQAQVERAPAAVDAQRPGAVHRPAGPPGDRAHARPAGHRGGAVQGQRRHRQRQPVRPGLPVDRTTPSPSGPRTSPRRSRCCRPPGTRPGSPRTWSPSSSWRSRSTPRSWCRRRRRSG